MPFNFWMASSAFIPSTNLEIPCKLPLQPPKKETVAKPVTAGKDNTASAWAADAVKWCVDNKILLGDDKGDLMLHQPLTREQACLVVQRLYDKIIDDAAGMAADRIIKALSEV